MVAHASVRVVLLFKVASLVAASLALAWISAAFVAFPLVLASNSVVLAARATRLVKNSIWWQVSAVFSAAEMTAQVLTKVVLDSMVESVVAAVDALACISAILVALLLVLAASLVSLAARLTREVREAISLQRDLSVTALVLLPLAMAEEERRRERKMVVNCIFAVGVIWLVGGKVLEKCIMVFYEM